MTSEEFLQRMLAVFGEPQPPNPKMFLQEYRDVLDQYSDALKTTGWTQLRDSHTYVRWPRPAECVKALNMAADTAQAKAAAQRVNRPPSYREPTPEERKRVQKLMTSLLANMQAKVKAQATPPPPVTPADRQWFETHAEQVAQAEGAAMSEARWPRQKPVRSFRR